MSEAEIPEVPPLTSEDLDRSEEAASNRTFDVVEDPDVRNYAYPASDLVAVATFQSRTREIDHVLDQGSEGACVGFGWSAEQMAEPVAYPDVDDAYAREVYQRAKEIDEWPGTSYEGTSVLAGAKVMRERGRLIEYRWVRSIDDARLVVGNYGPVVVGVNWRSGMDRPDGYGFVRPSGAIRGGHCFLIRGVNEEGGYFRCRNSWGPRYGKDGDFLLSIYDAAFLLSERNDWCVPVVRG